MDGADLAAILLLLSAVHEGRVGAQLAFRTKRTLEGAQLVYDEGNGRVVQEFGIYSLGIAAAYGIAAWDPARLWAVALVGVAFNLSAAGMHLSRSAGIYFGDVRHPIMSRRFERNAGTVHVLALLVLLAVVPCATMLT
jgi:hypothetical protein